MESYLSISNFEYRKVITKLRISEHNLLIEKKRHLNIPREYINKQNQATTGKL